MADPLAPIQRGRTGGLSGRLLGIPVTIHVSFLLILGFLGLSLGDPVRILVWVLVGGASVLLHEMGHAMAARLAGFAPRVDLAGMGGVTTYRGERGRGWGLFITGAGPGIQLLAGALAWPFVSGFGIPAGGDLAAFALHVWVVVSLLWGALNLVPILPLDGGQLFRNLLPGSPATRTRITQVVSVAMATAGMAWGLLSDRLFLVLLAGWFGWANLQPLLAGGPDGSTSGGRGDAGAAGSQPPNASTLLAGSQEHMARGQVREGMAAAILAVHAPGPAPTRAVAATTVVRALLDAGHAREAYRVVADPRHDLLLDEEVVARALAGHPDHDAVMMVARQAMVQRNDARSRGIVALLAALHGDVAAARTVMETGPVSSTVVTAVDRLGPRYRPPTG